MSEIPAPVRPPALPDSGLLRSALPRAVEHVRSLEDPRARLAFGVEVLTAILNAVEDLQAAELELKTLLGLSLPPDPEPDRGRPLLPARRLARAARRNP